MGTGASYHIGPGFFIDPTWGREHQTPLNQNGRSMDSCAKPSGIETLHAGAMTSTIEVFSLGLVPA